MSDTQNITLALPKEMLRRVRHLAVERGTSVSGLLKVTLERLLAEEDTYTEARSRYLAHVAEARDLGTGGRAGWTRESLHDR